MKQGKTLQELGKELQRQRLNRQDFLADTRSLEMESDSYGSMLNLSLDGKSLVVSNSEVGLGSLRVEPLVFRLVCKNGLICKDFAQRKYHVGRQVNISDDSAYELYSEETLAQDDKTFFLKVQDVVRCAVDEAKFMLTVDKLRESTQIPLKYDPVKSVELLADKFQLTENERGDILRQLFMGGDNSRYGLVNAVTAAGKIAKSYERATDLERIGGEILSLPISRNLLPLVVDAYQEVPEYETIPA